MLRSDNSREYECNMFKKFCYHSGIKLIRMMPRTPQQNGIAERMNRTLKRSCTRTETYKRLSGESPDYFGLEDVSGGEIMECGKKHIEEQGVQL